MLGDRTQYTYSFSYANNADGDNDCDDEDCSSRIGQQQSRLLGDDESTAGGGPPPLAHNEVLQVTRTLEEQTNPDGSSVVRQLEHSKHVAKVTRVETFVVRRRCKRLVAGDERSMLSYSSERDECSSSRVAPPPPPPAQDQTDQVLAEQVTMLGLTVPENTKANRETDDVVGDDDDDDDDEGMMDQSSYEGLFVKKGSSKESSPGGGWRDPDLSEVIEYLSDPDDAVKVNATAYLQHLCFNNDHMKAKTRALGGILSLVLLLRHDNPVVQRNACGALLNLCHGHVNDANKLEVFKVGGIEALSNLIGYSAFDDIREMSAAVLWNISCSTGQAIKMGIIRSDCLSTLVSTIIVPYSGWHPQPARRLNPQGIFPCSFKNATGVIRSCSSASGEARSRLRQCAGLVPSLLHAIQSALCSRNEVNSKCMENCVCVLRNLSFRVLDDEEGESRSSSSSSTLTTAGGGGGGGSTAAAELPSGGDALCHQLLQLVPSLVALVRVSSNAAIVEAIAGIFQNTTTSWPAAAATSAPAGKQMWAHRFRCEMRRAKAVHALCELLKLEKCDRLTATAAMALRNAALDDQPNQQIIAELATRDLVNILPDPFADDDERFSQNTLCSALCLLHELIRCSEISARNATEMGIVDRLLGMLRSPHLYSIKLLSYSTHLLNALWKHKHLHDLYRKMRYSSHDFNSHHKLLMHLITSASATRSEMSSTSCLLAGMPQMRSSESPRSHKLQRRPQDGRDWASTWSAGAADWNGSCILFSGTLFKPHGDLCPPSTGDFKQSMISGLNEPCSNAELANRIEQFRPTYPPSSSSSSSTAKLLPLYATVCKKNTNNNNEPQWPESNSDSNDADSWV